MVVVVRGGAVDGIDGYEVRVEVDAGRGLPAFHMVGLPDAAVRESRERVMSAVRNSGGDWPAGRVVVNLAPADVRKEGASLDRGVAGGVARGRGPTGPGLDDVVFLGELSLTGELKPVRGLLAVVLALAGRGRRRFVVPDVQREEARLAPEVEVAGASDLAEVHAWLRGDVVPPWRPGGQPLRRGSARDPGSRPPDLGGFGENLRRLALCAAAGRHNVLLVGPPGTGKTRLCRLIGALQPELDPAGALDVLRIAGAASTGTAGVPRRPARPFRAPHHTVTRAGLVGGGAGLRPGEATLAHHGVLFLDELTEFAPGVLEALREPLEAGRIALVRGGGVRTWPADFQLLAAANPCRCGWLGSARRACACTETTVRRHRDRLSGPLLDRIDLFAEVDESEAGLGRDGAVGEGDWTPTAVARRIRRARALLRRRGRPGDDLARARAGLDAGARDLLDAAASRLPLSVRGLIRAAGVAATLAALDGRPLAGRADAATALSWRQGAVLASAPASPG